MRKAFGLGVIVAALAVTAGAGGGRAAMSPLDQHWLMQSAQGDVYEVTVGKLAMQKGSNDEVKKFGSMLSEDHSKSLQDTNKVAKQLGVKVQAKPNPLQQAIITILSKTDDAAQFDSLFLQIAVGDHKVDIQDAKEEASKGQDTRARALARKELPTLQKHLQTATQLAQTSSSSTS